MPRFTPSPAAAGLVAAFVAMPTSAHAYLDAGTGSMLLQLLLGGLAGLAVAGKLYWHKLMVLVGVRKDAGPGAAEAAGRERE